MYCFAYSTNVIRSHEDGPENDKRPDGQVYVIVLSRSQISKWNIIVLHRVEREMQITNQLLRLMLNGTSFIIAIHVHNSIYCWM